MKVTSVTRIVVVLVGLPARGKTYIGRKVQRYLLWLGVNCRVFNVGEYRRKAVNSYIGHDFFDSNNKEAEKIRGQCALDALLDLISWFDTIHSGVAIYDATNSTIKRRKMVHERCLQHGIDVMFVESWCDDEDMILKNIMEVKKCSPDYASYENFQQVEKDFNMRIDHYKDVYQEVGSVKDIGPDETYDEANVTYVRKINVGAQMVLNRIKDYMQSRIVYFLMNIHITPRSILFSRHGESEYNQLGLLGGDSSLSPNGAKYAKALPALVSKIMGDQKLTVWTSTLQRTIQTASNLQYKKIQFKALDEINAGLCDALTYSQVKERYPEEYTMRSDNKFEFRYRGGESYRDVVLRLEPIIMELERQQNIMIVSHQAVLRCIYAYFLEISPEELPYIKIPLHTVMKLTWTAYGCEAQIYSLDIDAVDTHIKKPKVGNSASKNVPVSSRTDAPPDTSASSKQPSLAKKIPDSNDDFSENVGDLEPGVYCEQHDEQPTLTKHVEMYKFSQKRNIGSRLMRQISIPRNNNRSFAMEAQPVSSPVITTSVMSQIPEAINHPGNSHGSISNTLAPKHSNIEPILYTPSNKLAKNSNAAAEALPVYGEKSQKPIQPQSNSENRGGLGHLFSPITTDSSEVSPSTNYGCKKNLSPSLLSKSSGAYPFGSILSTYATPSHSNPDTPKDSAAASPRIHPTKDFEVSEHFADPEISRSFKALNLDHKSQNFINKCLKNPGGLSIPSIKVERSETPYSDDECKVPSSKKNPQKESDSSSPSLSDQALSLEKVEPLYLDGYGDVNVLQTKPALALSFAKGDDNQKANTTAVKQKLTGLENI